MVRVEALNHAIAGLPEERIRFHLCWGSWHGPHTTDIPMRDIVEVMLAINARAYSFEAGNVRHEHEWKVWQDVKLPDDKLILPGVVSHATNVVEHPELVADRILRFANLRRPRASHRLDRLRSRRPRPPADRLGQAGSAGAGGGAGQPPAVAADRGNPMIYSTDRILTTHAGSLPRPPDLREHGPRQGERRNPTTRRRSPRGPRRSPRWCSGRPNAASTSSMTANCRKPTSPIMSAGGSPATRARPSTGAEAARHHRPRRAEIRRLFRRRAAGADCSAHRRCRSASRRCAMSVRPTSSGTSTTSGRRWTACSVTGAFLPANTPGHDRALDANEYYQERRGVPVRHRRDDARGVPGDRRCRLPIADRRSGPAGRLGVPARHHLAEYRKYAAMRVDALNHALRGIPREKVRLHVCWGSFHGPHTTTSR